ncbi:MAG TPA: phage tail tube protein [Burkholderiaceae bacterium]|nr:phage tail tube protein [Burkholderiaceae bacterium]
MSNDIIIGSGVRVEIGSTEGAPKTISGISLSNPGVVSMAAHGLTFGSAGYFNNILGMDEIDGQAARVTDTGSPSADSFGLEDIDTTNFAVFTSGVFVPITAWSTLSQSTQYQLGGGAGKTEDIGTLIDTREKLLTLKNAAETVTIDVRSLKEDNAAMMKIRQVARSLGYLVFRITFPGGAQRLFRGQPSIPGESVTQGATGTGQLSVTIRGQICYLAA